MSENESGLGRVFREYLVHILSLLTCIVAVKVIDSIRPIVKFWDWKEFVLVCAVFSTILFAFQAVIALIGGVSVWQRAKIIYGLTGAFLVIGLIIAFWPEQLLAFLGFWFGIALMATRKVAGIIAGPVVCGGVLWLAWKQTLEALAAAVAILLFLNLLYLLEKRFWPLKSRA